MGTIRTFIALELPETVRMPLARLQRDLAGLLTAGVRWVKPDRMHLTIKFLGDTDEARVPPIAALLEQAAGGIPPLAIAVRGLGAFPNPRNAKVVWAGVSCCAALATLQGRIEAGLEPLGFAAERRPFAPHLTLGRVTDPRVRRELAALLAQRAEAAIGEGMLERMVLYRSELRPAGPEYTVLKEIVWTTS